MIDNTVTETQQNTKPSHKSNTSNNKNKQLYTDTQNRPTMIKTSTQITPKSNTNKQQQLTLQAKKQTP